MGEVSYEPLIRDMVWSHSRIKAFDDCPYRWYLKYVRYPKAKKKEMFFANYGKFVHELIASFYSGEKSREELEAEYLRDFRAHVKAYAPNRTVFKNYFVDGLNYIRRLQKPKNKVLSVENKVEFQIGNIPMIGYIDRLEEDQDGRILVIDNKSRTLKPRSHRSKPTKTDEELDQYLRQLYLYSIPVQDQFGKPPDKLCFDCFRSQLFIEEPFNEMASENAKQWVKDRVDEIAVETEFRPNMEYFKCRHLCEMQDYCDYFELTKR